MNSIIDSDRILIVGGTGFIGKRLVKRCLKETPLLHALGVLEEYVMKRYLCKI